MKRALDKELDSKFGETLEYLIDRYNDDDDFDYSTSTVYHYKLKGFLFMDEL